VQPAPEVGSAQWASCRERWLTAYQAVVEEVCWKSNLSAEPLAATQQGALSSQKPKLG
jgi:hypothetical protein